MGEKSVVCVMIDFMISLVKMMSTVLNELME